MTRQLRKRLSATQQPVSPDEASVNNKSGLRPRGAQSPQSSQKTFNIVGLPAETQLQIFQYLLADLDSSPPEIPSKATLNKHVPRPVMSAAAALLLACRSIFTQLAPTYWRTVTVRFSDPVEFANDFLMRLSPRAYNNLRHLKYFINNTLINNTGEMVGYYPCYHVWGDMRKFMEVLTVYKELRSLDSLTIQWYAGSIPERYFLTPVPASSEAEELWKAANSGLALFGKLEECLRKKTFKGYKVEKSARLTDHRPEWGGSWISVTFRKE